MILVEPKQWWVGYHRARSVPSRWPGGIMNLQLPPDAVSRAWLKMEEALAWSQLPARATRGSPKSAAPPGGSSQALLARGYEVLGIDPAKMAEEVVANPNFHHIRRRAAQVPRRAFRKVRWLTADMNVAPAFTLDAVEAIVCHAEVNIRGMLLTLKLHEWKLAAEVPAYLDRIRGWGCNLVQARQLAHNRHEICVAALEEALPPQAGERRLAVLIAIHDAGGRALLPTPLLLLDRFGGTIPRLSMEKSREPVPPQARHRVADHSSPDGGHLHARDGRRGVQCRRARLSRRRVESMPRPRGR